MTRLSDFETAILKELAKSQDDSIPIHWDQLVVSGRESTGVGFFTSVQTEGAPQLYTDGRTFVWSRLGARLGPSAVESGYVVYVRDGRVAMIEGFTYGDEWPQELVPRSFYVI